MTDRRMLLRGVLYVTLLRERSLGRPGWSRESRSFEANFSGICGDCGYPVGVGDVICTGRPHDTVSHLDTIRFIHETCPPWYERYLELFAIDGDLTLRELHDPNRQRCYVCEEYKLDLALVANPSPWPALDKEGQTLPWRQAAYVCGECRVETGRPTRLEWRRASRLNLPRPAYVTSDGTIAR